MRGLLCCICNPCLFIVPCFKLLHCIAKCPLLLLHCFVHMLYDNILRKTLTTYISTPHHIAGCSATNTWPPMYMASNRVCYAAAVSNPLIKLLVCELSFVAHMRLLVVTVIVTLAGADYIKLVQLAISCTIHALQCICIHYKLQRLVNCLQHYCGCMHCKLNSAVSQMSSINSVQCMHIQGVHATLYSIIMYNML